MLYSLIFTLSMFGLSRVCQNGVRFHFALTLFLLGYISTVSFRCVFFFVPTLFSSSPSTVIRAWLHKSCSFILACFADWKLFGESERCTEIIIIAFMIIFQVELFLYKTLNSYRKYIANDQRIEIHFSQTNISFLESHSKNILMLIFSPDSCYIAKNSIVPNEISWISSMNYYYWSIYLSLNFQGYTNW